MSFMNKEEKIMSPDFENKLLFECPDIKILDCTLRDGGLVNNFFFEDDFVKNLYLANVRSGVDYMEFGYKASYDLFDRKDYGKWKFCEEDDLRSIVGDNNTSMKLTVMADVGRTDYKRDILQKKDSCIDMIRVATYINQIPKAIDMIEDAHEKGYETTLNLMAVSKVTESDLTEAIKLLAQSDVDVIYLVDSYGALYPEQIEKLAGLYRKLTSSEGKKIGIHAHNNQQLAYANTIKALYGGVDYVDATIDGMGRGAGNCFLEMLMVFLKNPKYDVAPIMEFIAKDMTKLKNSGIEWGYDLSYMMTGVMNIHPKSAIKFMEEKRTDYLTFFHEILDM